MCDVWFYPENARADVFAQTKNYELRFLWEYVCGLGFCRQVMVLTGQEEQEHEHDHSATTTMITKQEQEQEQETWEKSVGVRRKPALSAEGGEESQGVGMRPPPTPPPSLLPPGRASRDEIEKALCWAEIFLISRLHYYYLSFLGLAFPPQFSGGPPFSPFWCKTHWSWGTLVPFFLMKIVSCARASYCFLLSCAKNILS